MTFRSTTQQNRTGLHYAIQHPNIYGHAIYIWRDQNARRRMMGLVETDLQFKLWRHEYQRDSRLTHSCLYRVNSRRPHHAGKSRLTCQDLSVWLTKQYKTDPLLYEVLCYLSTVDLHSKLWCFAFFRTLRQNVVYSFFATPSTIWLRTWSADDSFKSIDLNRLRTLHFRVKVYDLCREFWLVSTCQSCSCSTTYTSLTEPCSATIIVMIKARAQLYNYDQARARLCNLG